MLDILHHVYFFSRKFGKNPKKMCFCYWVSVNTLIITISYDCSITVLVTLIVIVVILVVVGLYQMYRVSFHSKPKEPAKHINNN